MAYFHLPVCISPQNSFPEVDLYQIRESKNNLLEAIEPAYPGIPAAARRRMGKSVRMAVGAALPILEKFPQPDGIIIATANGGMEDCIKFLNQIVEYNEGLLTPANFVQSTSNAAASQIALVTKNHNYNITHVHRGLAFENALMDTMMLLKENKDAGYLLGSTDVISAYNYNIDRNAGCFRDELILNTHLFQSKAKGTIPGEGAFMVMMNNQKMGASAGLNSVKTIHSIDPLTILKTLEKFLSENFIPGEWPDLLLTGEDGDERLLPYIDIVESFMDKCVPVARFKHFCGDYCTASSFACWISMQIFETGTIPDLLIKKRGATKPVRKILIYNNYRGAQHAFILVSAV
ncbi:MAG TPA: beta-ketoacyl synthase chain length factor [Puia sp.]|nr:beta-ketoacyl synthase chain length factor [Puia sp.]